MRREGKNLRDGKGKGEMGKGGRARGREGAEGGERLGKWKGALDLDVCPGAPRS